MPFERLMPKSKARAAAEKKAINTLRNHPELQEHIREHGEKFVFDFWKGCNNAVTAAKLGKGKRLMVIADEHRRAIAEGVQMAAELRGIRADTFVAGSLENPVDHSGHPVVRAMQDAVDGAEPNVIYLMVHKDSWKKRTPVYDMGNKYGFTYTSPYIRHIDVAKILSENVKSVQKRTRHVFDFVQWAQRRKGGAPVELHTGEGSHLKLDLSKVDTVSPDDMLPPKIPFQGHFIANLPGGEVETTNPRGVEGDVFFDAGSVFGEAGYVTKGITVKFKNSKIVEMLAHSKADQKVVDRMNGYFKSIGSGKVQEVVEFAIGTNEYIPLEMADTELTREKVFGTIHIGVGNKETGEHSDLVAKVRNMSIAGKDVIKEGEWVLRHRKSIINTIKWALKRKEPLPSS